MSMIHFSANRYREALRFATRAHAGQLLPGSDMPYLVHVVEVAAEVTEAIMHSPLMDSDLAISCALLHDVVEDTSITAEMVRNEFGEAVCRGVLALSKNPDLPAPLAMVDSLERIRKCPPEIGAVKMADRIANLHVPPAHWSASKKTAYREEAQQILDALKDTNAYLAKRLKQRIEDYVLFI